MQCLKEAGFSGIILTNQNGDRAQASFDRAKTAEIEDTDRNDGDAAVLDRFFFDFGHDNLLSLVSDWTNATVKTRSHLRIESGNSILVHAIERARRPAPGPKTPAQYSLGLIDPVNRDAPTVASRGIAGHPQLDRFGFAAPSDSTDHSHPHPSHFPSEPRGSDLCKWDACFQSIAIYAPLALAYITAEVLTSARTRFGDSHHHPAFAFSRLHHPLRQRRVCVAGRRFPDQGTSKPGLTRPGLFLFTVYQTVPTCPLGELTLLWRIVKLMLRCVGPMRALRQKQQFARRARQTVFFVSRASAPSPQKKR